MYRLAMFILMLQKCECFTMNQHILLCRQFVLAAVA